MPYLERGNMVAVHYVTVNSVFRVRRARVWNGDALSGGLSLVARCYRRHPVSEGFGQGRQG